MRHDEGWTTDTLRIYLDKQIETLRLNIARRFDDAEKALSVSLVSSKDAVAKAEIATEKRFDTLNGYRAIMADQAARLMPRAEIEQRTAGLNDRLDRITHRMDLQEGKETGSQNSWAYLLGAVAIFGTLANIILIIVLHK
jgi:hypothetical protein